MTGKTLTLTLVLLAGCMGAARGGTAPVAGEKTPQLCTNDKARVDATHIYTAGCPSVSAIRRPDGTWAPAKDGPGASTSPTTTDEPGVPADANGKPAAPGTGSGTTY